MDAIVSIFDGSLLGSGVGALGHMAGLSKRVSCFVGAVSGLAFIAAFWKIMHSDKAEPIQPQRVAPITPSVAIPSLAERQWRDRYEEIFGLTERERLTADSWEARFRLMKGALDLGSLWRYRPLRMQCDPGQIPVLLGIWQLRRRPFPERAEVAAVAYEPILEQLIAAMSDGLSFRKARFKSFPAQARAVYRYSNRIRATLRLCEILREQSSNRVPPPSDLPSWESFDRVVRLCKRVAPKFELRSVPASLPGALEGTLSVNVRMKGLWAAEFEFVDLAGRRLGYLDICWNEAKAPLVAKWFETRHYRILRNGDRPEVRAAIQVAVELLERHPTAATLRFEADGGTVHFLRFAGFGNWDAGLSKKVYDNVRWWRSLGDYVYPPRSFDGEGSWWTMHKRSSVDGSSSLYHLADGMELPAFVDLAGRDVSYWEYVLKRSPILHLSINLHPDSFL